MAPRRQDRDDVRNTPFELPDSFYEALKPGFKRAEKAAKAAVDDESHRFPRVAAEKDVPKTSLATRIAKRK